MAAPHNEVARYFSLVNFPAAAPAAPRPVVIEASGYGGDRILSADGAGAAAARYYGFTYLQITSSLTDGAAGFSLQFGNDGVANDAGPTPCAEGDSRDVVYLRALFAFVEAQGDHLDAARVFMRGFSQVLIPRSSETRLHEPYKIHCSGR
jgi:hypothetical protein